MLLIPGTRLQIFIAITKKRRDFAEQVTRSNTSARSRSSSILFTFYSKPIFSMRAVKYRNRNDIFHHVQRKSERAVHTSCFLVQGVIDLSLNQNQSSKAVSKNR